MNIMNDCTSHNEEQQLSVGFVRWLLCLIVLLQSTL